MIDNDLDFFQPAAAENGPIVPEGQWTLELLSLEKVDADPRWMKPGDDPFRIRWVFALYDDKGQRFHFNGEPYEFFRTTSTKNTPRASARKYAEALLGRPLADKERPKPADLLGKRMRAIVIHEQSRTDPERKVIELASLKNVPSANGTASAPAAAPSGDDPLHAKTLAQVRAVLKRAKSMKLAGADGYDDAVLAEMPTEALSGLFVDLSGAVADAMSPPEEEAVAF